MTTMIFLCIKSAEKLFVGIVHSSIHAQIDREDNMEREQKEKYMAAIAGAIALVIGPRDEDYNKGGIDLRDYWEVNGILGPVQMVDMKLKRAFSQLALWKSEEGNLVPKNRQQVDKLAESMLDLINYAAFVICEAETLYEEKEPTLFNLSELPPYTGPAITLSQRLLEAVILWIASNKKPK